MYGTEKNVTDVAKALNWSVRPPAILLPAIGVQCVNWDASLHNPLPTSELASAPIQRALKSIGWTKKKFTG
jgi:hypothetical protein